MSQERRPAKSRVHALVIMAALLAMEIVLSRFLSFSAWNMKIGFAFLPVAVAAILLGPVRAGVVGGVADFLGAILFPIGAYFPGFTLTAFLTGFVYGLLLRPNRSFWWTLAAVLIHQLVLSLLVNSLWISVLYGSPYVPVLTSRLLQCAIMIPVELAVIELVHRVMGGYLQKETMRT